MSEPVTIEIDYAVWDWLPGAAEEIQHYLERLLEESGITAHAVTARAKSISSFQRKRDSKKPAIAGEAATQTPRYDDPLKQITDIVAVRVMTYSTTDRDRVCELIRGRFAIKPGEDRNPGEEKPSDKGGYDCRHIVVVGESEGFTQDWLTAGGDLMKYFGTFSGLEIQVRTVAAHAWAEFEHARRYKGAQYRAVDPDTQETTDLLFAAAADARRSLDQIFVAIDQVLARPAAPATPGPSESEDPGDQILHAEDTGSALPVTALTEDNLRDYLEGRYPDDGEATARGVEFGLALVRSCGLNSVDELEAVLETVDSSAVRELMGITMPVTRVRRLDDDLLAWFKEAYVELSGDEGAVPTRRRQLQWRYDRLRGKSRPQGYLIHSDAPGGSAEIGPFTAAKAVRVLAQRVALQEGIEAILVDPHSLSRDDDLLSSARAREVVVDSENSIWVRTNLNREYSELLLRKLTAASSDATLAVTRADTVLAQKRGTETGEPAQSVVFPG